MSVKKAAVFLFAVALVALLLYPNPKTHPNSAVMHSKSQSNSSTSWTAKYLPNEKLSLKYPSDWGETDDPVSSGSDGIVLTSPSNLLVNISTGATKPASSFSNILASTPINTLGSNYFLDFYNDHQSTGGLAEGACVATEAGSGASFPISKNIASSADGAEPVNKVCISYPSDESGRVIENTVSDFQKDPSYKQAVEVIQSINYKL